MRTILMLACLLCLLTTAATQSCSAAQPVDNDSGIYPRHQLRFEDLRQTVMAGQQESVPYYEIFSLDPMAYKTIPLPLPVLRKVALKWILQTDPSVFPGNFSNDYTGWAGYMSDCEEGGIQFQTMQGPYWKFRFQSVYPEVEYMIGTSFSSCPERYLINWYCPEQHIRPNIHTPRECSSKVRMSIYSPDGPNNLPWHLIVKDLCKNLSPPMDDPRWTMTYDAPQQCPFTPEIRKKRSMEDSDFVRHYM